LVHRGGFNDLEGGERYFRLCGRQVPNPSYQLVCSGTTGHAEAVQVTFDPQVILYKELLEIFFTIHDPTTLNRQGPDVGTQYRSAVFYHGEEQRATAEQVMREIEAAGIWDAPLVTELAPLDKFYPAEDYHQEYFKRNPKQPYCSMVAPKVAKFRKKYADRLKKEGAMTPAKPERTMMPEKYQPIILRKCAAWRTTCARYSIGSSRSPKPLTRSGTRSVTATRPVATFAAYFPGGFGGPGFRIRSAVARSA
jgi:peptide-methionine (S)-S-oxide reductase